MEAFESRAVCLGCGEETTVLLFSLETQLLGADTRCRVCAAGALLLEIPDGLTDEPVP